jgi:hypothetical protein
LFSHKSHISASETSKFEKCGSFHSKSWFNENLTLQ